MRRRLLPLVLSCFGAREAYAVEIVVAGEALAVRGDELPGEMTAFLRRVEEAAHLPAGSVTGRAFIDATAAAAYIAKRPAAFAIVPVRTYVTRARALGFRPIGSAVELGGAEPAYRGVARAGKLDYEHIEFRPGLRLAGIGLDDKRWLSQVVFETNVRAEKHFKLQPSKTTGDALVAVVAGQADVALLYESEYRRHAARLEKGGDLQPVYVSWALPPPPILAGPKSPRKVREKLVKALPEVCQDNEICARLDILRLEAAAPSRYDTVVAKYAP